MSISLPVVSVQHDYRDVLKDVGSGAVDEDKFWISCFKRGSRSVHASVVVTRSGTNPPFTLNCAPETGITISSTVSLSVFFILLVFSLPKVYR